MSSKEKSNKVTGSERTTDYGLPIGLLFALLIFSFLPSKDKSKEIAIALDPNGPDELALSVGRGKSGLGNDLTPIMHNDQVVMVTSKKEKTEGGGDDPDKKLYNNCFEVGNNAGQKDSNAAAQSYIFTKVTFDKQGAQVIRDLFWCLHQYDSNSLKSTEYETALQNFCDHYNNLSYKKRVGILGIIYGLLQQRYSPKDIQTLKNNGFPGAGDFQTLNSKTI